MATISFSVHHKDKKFVLKQEGKKDLIFDNTNQLNAAVITLIAPYLRADTLTTPPDQFGQALDIKNGKLAFNLNVFKDIF